MNIVITAGGTSEYIDRVRKITNSGTGKLGAIIADQLAQRDDVTNIYYICSINAVTPATNDDFYIVNNRSNKKAVEKTTVIRITDTAHLQREVQDILKEQKIDWFIHSMAVSDYYVSAVTTAKMLAEEIADNIENHSTPFEQTIKNPENTLDNSDKLSSSEDNLVLVLKQTPKVIGSIKKQSPETHLIGFKLLENVTTEELIQTAAKLRDKNNCDYVIANDLTNIKKGTHKAHVLSKDGSVHTVFGKTQIAKAIDNIIS